VFLRLKTWVIYWSIYDWQVNAHLDRAIQTKKALTLCTTVTAAKSMGTLRWAMQQWCC